jgi:hypothetical protein
LKGSLFENRDLFGSLLANKPLLSFNASMQRLEFCANQAIDGLFPRQRGLPPEDLDHDGSGAGCDWFVSG